jgi:hypothetical protein
MASRKKRHPSAPKPPAFPAAASAPAPPPNATPLALIWPDLLFGGILAVLVVFFLNLSWRKWPDPQIDFGRELYLPWRLSQGAVLYRDLQHMYGPFSPYFNSLVFRIGGASLTSLIVANLFIYAGILGLLYYFLRAGWGRLAAFVSCAVFVSVFSFSHLVGIGNYNFITPYAHEATHGILLTLLLIGTLLGLLTHGKRWQFFCSGLLVGISVLMKPETMLAAGAVSFGAILLAARDRFRAVRADWAVKLPLLFAGGLTPMALAVLLFHLGAGQGWGEALREVNTAWLNVFTYSGALSTPMQMSSMGTDHLGANLAHEIVMGLCVLGFVGGAAWGCRYFPQWGMAAEAFWATFLVIAGLFVAALVPWQDLGPDAKLPDWMNMGTAIPGMLFITVALLARQIWRQPRPAEFDRQTAVRALLWLAGVAFLFRMLFNPRVFHYGFFQAPLAMCVGLATLLVAVPDFLRVQGALRKVFQGVLMVIIFWGAGGIAYRSASILAAQTFPVGTGADQFLAFDVKTTGMPSGALIEVAREYLAKDPGAHSLLVVPEGVMLNYLTRLPDPIPNYEVGAAQFNVLGNVILSGLEANPPNRIVLISRDLREYGVNRFGDTPEHGAALLDFIYKNYVPVYNPAGDPLDYRQAGVTIYALRPDYTPPPPSAPAPHA